MTESEPPNLPAIPQQSGSLRQYFDHFSEEWTSSPALRAMWSVIGPVLAPFLVASAHAVPAASLAALAVTGIDNALTTRAATLVERRFLALIESLREAVSHLSAHAVRTEYLESDEFTHLVLTTFDRAARTRSHEKIRRFARLLASVAVANAITDDDAETSLELLDELTDREFLVCAEILQRERRTDHPRDWNELNHGMAVFEGLREWSGLSSHVLRGVLARAASKGALREVVGAYSNYGGGIYRVLPTFAHLYDLVASAHPPIP